MADPADLPEYSVVEATWHHHPFLSDGDGAPLEINPDVPPEILIKIGEDWIPPGCETWDVTDENVAERSTWRVLARPT